MNKEFETALNHWAEVLNLGQYRIFLEQEEDLSKLGSCRPDTHSMTATIGLSKILLNDKKILNETCFHELAHLLLWPLTEMAGESVGLEKAEHEAHKVINILIKLIFDKMYIPKKRKTK